MWTGNLGDMPHFEKEEGEGLRQINRLLDRRVDGLIMWPPFSVAYYHHFPEFVERRVPVAVIDHYSTVADSVETDEEQAASVVAEHLLSLGPSPDRMPFQPRNAVANLGRETHAARSSRRSSAATGATVKSWHLNAQGSNGVEVARQLLSEILRPTAVFAVSDHEAAFVYQAAGELGMNIPRDLSVVGFADLDFAATMDPPLTTMRQKPHEIGRLAAKLIMDRIDGIIADEDEPTTVKVPADLVVRNSTSKPLAAD